MFPWDSIGQIVMYNARNRAQTSLWDMYCSKARPRPDSRLAVMPRIFRVVITTSERRRRYNVVTHLRRSGAHGAVGRGRECRQGKNLQIRFLSLSLFREVEDVVAYASDGRPHRTEASKPYPRGDPSLQRVKSPFYVFCAEISQP